MVKPLNFKGDKKPKKRKRADNVDDNDGDETQASKVVATTSAEEEDDSWVTADAADDVRGPVIFLLPTTPPSCIACDANGKVFPSQIENMVEGDPSTAEPHDVRQVWIANRVAGTENFSFKGHHGRYLGCDKFGIVSATHEARSNEESFLCIPAPQQPSMFSVQTTREKFITVDSNDDPSQASVRGDAEDMNFNTILRIRMQARFKPRLKASKEEKASQKISRRELEDAVGRKLEDEEVKKLKKARREGTYHEALLDVKVKGKHDKFA